MAHLTSGSDVSKNQESFVSIGLGKRKQDMINDDVGYKIVNQNNRSKYRRLKEKGNGYIWCSDTRFDIFLHLSLEFEGEMYERW